MYSNKGKQRSGKVERQTNIFKYSLTTIFNRNDVN